MDFQVVQVVKNLPANAGGARDAGLIAGPGRSSGGGNGNPLQYCCLENSMNRWAWWATVHGSQRIRHDWAHKHIVHLGFSPSGFPSGKEFTCSAADMVSNSESGRSPEEENGNPLQCSCLENFMDRGAWQAAFHGVAKNWTRLSN